MYNVLYIACCYANSLRWYMGLFSVESVLWTISQIFVSSAHTCTKQHYIITVISFTYLKMNRGTYQQVTAFVNIRNVSKLTAVDDSLQGHT